MACNGIFKWGFRFDEIFNFGGFGLRWIYGGVRRIYIGLARALYFRECQVSVGFA